LIWIANLIQIIFILINLLDVIVLNSLKRKAAQDALLILQSANGLSAEGYTGYLTQGSGDGSTIYKEESQDNSRKNR
jgi:hypothetical protein